MRPSMVQPELRPPLVTVAMPVLNVERTVLEAIESILYQTLTDWELLVIDDGSTDRTGEVLGRIRDPRVRVVTHQQNVGVGQRLNEAVALARGKYFARLDGDDIAYPDRLETQLEYLRTHPEVDLVGSWLVLLDRERTAFGSWRPPEHHAGITSHAYHSILLAHPTFFGLHDWFVKNPYLPEFLHTEDQILLMHTASHSRFANVQRALVAYQQPDSHLRAVVRRRLRSCGNTTRFFARKRQYGSLLRSLVTHGGVTALECLADITRMRHRLLIHRVSQLSREQEAEWQKVWSLLTAAVEREAG